MDAHDASTEAPENQPPDDHTLGQPADAARADVGDSSIMTGEPTVAVDDHLPGDEAPAARVLGSDGAGFSTESLPESAATALALAPVELAPLPVARLERDDMAWPPAPWERSPGAWRDDVWTGPAPFQPYGAGPEPSLPTEATAVPAGGGGKRLAREIVETAILTLIIFLGIKLVVQNFKIQGASMERTLHDGQFLLVNRLPHYGIGQPERGDIVVFKAWEQGSGSEERDFIKRVIGLPNETIEIRDNTVFVNNEVLPEPYLDPGNPTTDRIGPITLNDDEYYVMGDNRGNSSDSRTYGPLNKERIIGKAWLSYWPPGNIGIVPGSDSSHAATSDSSFASTPEP